MSAEWTYEGLYIIKIKSGSITEEKGIQIEDLITDINGRKIKCATDFLVSFADITTEGNLKLTVIDKRLKRIDYIKERIPYLEEKIKRLSKVISDLDYEIRATSHDIPPDSGRWLVGGRPARPSGLQYGPSQADLNEWEVI